MPKDLLCGWRESNPREPLPTLVLFSDDVRFVIDSRGGPYSQPSAHRPGSYPGVRPTLGSCDPEPTPGIEPRSPRYKGGASP